MSGVEVPDQMPCEKCGKLTAYDGTIGANAPCEHCGTPRPHTMTGSTGKPLLPFLIFFAGAFVFTLVNPWHLDEDQLFFVCFGIFCLMFLFLGVLPVVIAVWEVKKKSKEKEER